MTTPDPKQTGEIDPAQGAKTDPGQREKMLRATLRRIGWLAGLVVVTFATAWIANNFSGAEEMWKAWVDLDITGYQAAWTTLSIAAVVAVYWWGVGTGSRYEPPAVSTLGSVDMVTPPPAKEVPATIVAAAATTATTAPQQD